VPRTASDTPRWPQPINPQRVRLTIEAPPSAYPELYRLNAQLADNPKVHSTLELLQGDLILDTSDLHNMGVL
jgi:hypothetical protein